MPQSNYNLAPRWMNLELAAKVTGINVNELRRAVAAGEIESWVPPHMTYPKITVEAVDAWVMSGESGACENALRLRGLLQGVK